MLLSRVGLVTDLSVEGVAEHLSQHVGEGLRLARLGGVQNGGLHASGECLAE